MKTNQAKRIMSRVAAAGVTAAMVGATVMGGMAANLADLPAPFVQNGQADVTIVLGGNAAVDDMLGAVDIATALQASNVVSETVNVPGQGTQFTVADGLQIRRSGQDLTFGEEFNMNDLKFTRIQWPTLLADGEIRNDETNDQWNYRQEILFPSGNSATVTFDKPSFMNQPELMVSFDGGEAAYRYVVNFDDSTTDLKALENSETIEMLGRTFTFDPTNANRPADQLRLYGSDTVSFLRLNVPQTITVDGQTYEIEIIGANSDGPNIVLSVNGQQRSMEEGQSRVIAGLDLFVKDVFVTNIPTLDASANVFIGSEEFNLIGQNGQSNQVELSGSGNVLDGMYFTLIGTDFESVNRWEFDFIPQDLDDEEDRYLRVGESITDPMFGMQMTFAGVSPQLNQDERSYINIDSTNNRYRLSFVNKDGLSYSGIDVLERVSGEDHIRYMEAGSGSTTRFVINPTASDLALERNDFFVGQQGTDITKMYTVHSITGTSGNERVIFRDLASNAEYTVYENEFLDSTNIQVTGIQTTGDRYINVTGALRNYIVTDGDMRIDFAPLDFYNTSSNVNQTSYMYSDVGSEYVKAVWTFSEDYDDRFNTHTTPSVWDITFEARATGTDRMLMSGPDTTAGEILTQSDDSGNTEYGMTEYGTYTEQDVDRGGRFYRLYYPVGGEANYAVFLSPSGSTVGTGASGGQVTTSQIVPINVGAAVLDRNVNVATASTNLIVIGGPRANSVANTLLGMPSQEDIDMMFPAGRAIVRLFELDTGKTAMLVAGHEAMETQAASRKVAQFDPALMGQEATMTVTSLNNVQITTSN